MQPPAAPRRPHSIEMHGERWEDPYFWLRDREDPATRAYLEAENAYATAALADTAALQEQIFAELRGRVQEDDASVPERIGPFDYYTRFATGQQYPVYCRRPAGGGAEQMILDVNALAVGQGYCRIGTFKVSPDHTLLAYGLDTSGDEAYTVFVKDLRTDALLPDQLPNSYYSLEWAADGAQLLYTALDAAHRPDRVLLHRLSADPATDRVLLQEPDERFFVNIRKTRSAAYLLITLDSTVTSEVQVAPADLSTPFAPVAPRVQGHEYHLEHQGDSFWIWSNLDAPNFQLLVAPTSAPERANWRVVLPHRADTLIVGVAAFRSFLAVFERHGGLPQIRLSAPDGRSTVRYIAFPEPVYAVAPLGNHEYAADALRLSYSSLVTPETVVDYAVAGGDWQVRKVRPIPSGYDPAQYVCERLTATAPDGAQVPISLLRRRDRAPGGRLLLYGYGAYGLIIPPSFNANVISLVDRGFAYAIAHIRGGEDLGRHWYEQGRMLEKRNSFTDFIACAEHLIAQGLTSSERLGISGRSAGGLLTGAVVTMRPDLCAAAILGVPFLDVVSTMADATIPLTTNEWEQWGNPANEPEYRYIKSYSPYDNLRATRYPALLLTAGFNDPRVAYWEPAKFTAKLRALAPESRVLLQTNMDVGHGGASGRFDRLREVAEECAFLLNALE